MTNRLAYSLSTAWNYRCHRTAKEITDEIKSLGFGSIELNFALTEAQVNDFIKLCDSGYIRISSTHNFCPLPDGVDPKDASPEYYSLSSLDENERAFAVKFTKKSMDFAKRLGAAALILHLGRVEVKDKTKKLFVTRDKTKFEKEKKEALAERAKKAKPYFEKALKSLRELLGYADAIDFDIAVENRYYMKEMPSLEEFEIIFKKFDNRHLFYWHDTGHAQVYENLSILKHEDYLKALSNRLLGFHLHDIILFDDHRAPGSGEFDFKRLRPFLNKNVITVIEAHRIATPQEVRKSVAYLKEALGR